jgi:hypothetical protein
VREEIAPPRVHLDEASGVSLESPGPHRRVRLGATPKASLAKGVALRTSPHIRLVRRRLPARFAEMFTPRSRSLGQTANLHPRRGLRTARTFGHFSFLAPRPPLCRHPPGCPSAAGANAGVRQRGAKQGSHVRLKS